MDMVVESGIDGEQQAGPDDNESSRELKGNERVKEHSYSFFSAQRTPHGSETGCRVDPTN